VCLTSYISSCMHIAYAPVRSRRYQPRVKKYAVPRYNVKRVLDNAYRCKRKKENQGPRRKYEQNNMSGALEVADAFTLTRTNIVACRSQIILLFLFLSFPSISLLLAPLLSYFRYFPHRGEDASPCISRAARAIILSHTVNR